MEPKTSREDLLRQAIAGEGKTPLGDQKLAEMLGISRSAVIELRQRLGIPSSAKRLAGMLRRDVGEILARSPGESVRAVHRRLRDMGYVVSQTTVYQTMKGLERGGEGPEAPAETPPPSGGPQGFDRLLGHDGSLSRQVDSAKSAVLYPPSGLNTLLIGETGVGKSLFARCMYEFALLHGVMEEGRFVQFNCADYANNPDLLCSQLFGHVRGAYTGADRDKFGLVALADRGILFLDEVHRLPAEGQEMLFGIIDHGRYRRMGESGDPHQVSTMIVAATTENINSSLLATFRRRIPMTISLPSYGQRSVAERLAFVRLFVGRESGRIQKDIELSYEVCSALVAYDPPYNMGQLESDIRVSIAKAYLQFVMTDHSVVRVTLDMLPAHIIEAWRERGVSGGELTGLVRNRLVVSGDRYDAGESGQGEEDIYRYIDQKRTECLGGDNPEEIQRELTARVEAKIAELLSRNRFGWEKNTKYYKGVDKRLLEIVEDFLSQAGGRVTANEQRRQTLQYSLGFHLQTMLNQLQSGLEIIHPNLLKTREESPELYALAAELIARVETALQISIPEDEIGYICTYLRVASRDGQNERVGVVVACHGEVATKMLEVAAHFVGDSEAVSVDMPLSLQPTEVYRQVRDAVRRVDQGRGVLLLTDMGSLVTFGEEIEKETGVRVETLARADTMMLMGAMCWVTDPEYGVADIKEKLLGIQTLPRATRAKPCVLCISRVDDGGAEFAAEYLRENFIGTESRYTLVARAPVGGDTPGEIAGLAGGEKIALVIGDEAMRGQVEAPFFTMRDIGMGDGFESLQQTLNLPLRVSLKRVLRKSIILIDPPERTREEIIRRLCRELVESGSVTGEFIRDIMAREAMVSTYVGAHIAIPHTLDFDHIRYSQIGVAVFREPIEWAQFPVNFVGLLALRKNGDQYFEQLYKQVVQHWDALLETDRPEEIRRLITGPY